MIDTAADWAQARRSILARYLQLLADSNSPLLGAGDPVLEQVTAQLLGVVDAVRMAVNATSVVPGAAAIADPSEAIGRSRAYTGIHPSQSLHAAALIFEAVLPAVTEWLTQRADPTPEHTAGILLNREILQRMAAAARSYVDYLLDKAHASNRDERRRQSRELHDVAAPAVAIGLQNLELFEVYKDTDPARAEGKIDAARLALLDALATIRSLSAESREAVAASGLCAAVDGLLANLPTNIHTSVSTDGDLNMLSLAATEELFLIIREAVRNAVEHAKPRTITVTLIAQQLAVTAEVRDDGIGFDVATTRATSRRVGIDSMRERAELLDADLDLSSSADEGTTVTVRVPLPRTPLARASA